MKVYVVLKTYLDISLTVCEKVFTKEDDAKAFCEANNKENSRVDYDYEEHEAE